MPQNCGGYFDFDPAKEVKSKECVLIYPYVFNFPSVPRPPMPNLGRQRTLGDEAMAELGARQELYYANSGADDPGYSKAS